MPTIYCPDDYPICEGGWCKSNDGVTNPAQTVHGEVCESPKFVDPVVEKYINDFKVWMSRDPGGGKDPLSDQKVSDRSPFEQAYVKHMWADFSFEGYKPDVVVEAD